MTYRMRAIVRATRRHLRTLGVSGSLFLATATIARAQAGATLLEPVNMFPQSDVTIELQQSSPVQTIAIEMWAEGYEAAPLSTVTANREPDDKFRATIACPFVGGGTMKVIEDGAAPGSPPLLEEPCRCDPPTATTSGGIYTSQEPGLMTIGGKITAVNQQRFLRIDTVVAGVSGAGFITTLDTVTRDTIEECVINQKTELPPGATEPFTTDSKTCTPIVDVNTSRVPIHLQRTEGTVTTKEERMSDGLLLFQEDETFTSTSTFSATVEYPEIPEGALPRESRAVGPASHSRPTAWMFPGGTITEADPGFPGFAFGCVNGEISTSVGSPVFWTFPGSATTVTQGTGTQSISMTGQADCLSFEQGDNVFPNSPRSGVQTTRSVNQLVGGLQGSVMFELDVAPEELTLMLMPEEQEVPPTGPEMPTVTTNIVAQLSGGLVGSQVQVGVDLTAFDAAISGHNHNSGTPPSTLWGNIDGGLTSSCTLTIQQGQPGDPPGGSCTVTYTPNVVGGRLQIDGAIALVDGQPPAEPITAMTTLDVRVGILVDIEGLFIRDSERLNGGLATHPRAYFFDGSRVGLLLDMANDWEMETGTYLSFNDLSLPFGGVFDFLSANPWAPPHAEHRIGRSADINRKRFSVVNEGVEVTPEIDDRANPAEGIPLRNQLAIICARNGGQLYKTDIDKNLHCEFM